MITLIDAFRCYAATPPPIISPPCCYADADAAAVFRIRRSIAAAIAAMLPLTLRHCADDADADATPLPLIAYDIFAPLMRHCHYFAR